MQLDISKANKKVKNRSANADFGRSPRVTDFEVSFKKIGRLLQDLNIFQP